MRQERDGGFRQNPNNETRFTTIKYNLVNFDYDDLLSMARNILHSPEAQILTLRYKNTSPVFITHERLEKLRNAPGEEQEQFVIETAAALREAKRAVLTITEPEPMKKPKAQLPPVSLPVIGFINNELIDFAGFINDELSQLDIIGKPNEKTKQKPTSKYSTREATIMHPTKEEAQSIVRASANNPNKAILLFWGEKKDPVAAKPVKPHDVSNKKGEKGLGMLVGEILNADGVVLVEMKKISDTSM